MFKRLKTLLLPVAILAAVLGGVSAHAATLPETRVGGYQVFDGASRPAQPSQVPESQQAIGFSWYDTASECSVAAESPSFNSIMRQVETVDVSTPRNGAVFWTGYERGNQAAAMKWAAANGKSTIEMTPGGQWLNSLDLYGVNSPLTRAEADAAWLRMSERFTEGASGHINAFTRGTSFNPASNFYNTELPGLRLNPNVSPTITYRGY